MSQPIPDHSSVYLLFFTGVPLNRKLINAIKDLDQRNHRYMTFEVDGNPCSEITSVECYLDETDLLYLRLMYPNDEFLALRKNRHE